MYSGNVGEKVLISEAHRMRGQFKIHMLKKAVNLKHSANGIPDAIAQTNVL